MARNLPESLPIPSTTEYVIMKKHERESGLIQVPLATDDGESCEIIRLHNPIERLALYWEAKRSGAPPEVPSPYSLEPNCVFLNGYRTPAAPMSDGQPGDATEELPTADQSQKKLGGRYIWQMSGVYYYALRKPMDLNSSIVAGKMPFDNIKVVDTVIPASSFKTDLLKLKPDESSPDIPVTHPNWPGNDTQFLNPFIPSP